MLTNLIEGLDETNTLKSNLYKKLCAICDTKSLQEYSGTSKNAANVQALGNAIREQRKVILKDYASASSATVRDRWSSRSSSRTTTSMCGAMTARNRMCDCSRSHASAGLTYFLTSGTAKTSI